MVQEAITSADLPEKFNLISKKFNLRIDQSGVLQSQTTLVMLGLENSTDFIKNLMENAEMTKELAVAITTEVNTQIFSGIRSYLREMETVGEEKIADTNADIEKAGNFSVEKDQSAASLPAQPAENINKTDLLNSIENPDSQSNLPINMVNSLPATATSVQPSPLVDHLMSTPIATPHEIIEKKIPSSPPVPASRPSSDPYREPIE